MPMSPSSATAVTRRTALAVLFSHTVGGAGFAAKEPDGSWAQVPFAVPLRTGILLAEGTAESSGHSEVMMLMTHAEICLRMRLADGAHLRLCWYQGIEGYTGWHAGAPQHPYNQPDRLAQTATLRAPSSTAAPAQFGQHQMAQDDELSDHFRSCTWACCSEE